MGRLSRIPASPVRTEHYSVGADGTGAGERHRVRSIRSQSEKHGSDGHMETGLR